MTRGPPARNRRAISCADALDMSGQWNRWYAEAIPHAEQLYEIYLKNGRKALVSCRSQVRLNRKGLEGITGKGSAPVCIGTDPWCLCPIAVGRP